MKDFTKIAEELQQGMGALGAAKPELMESFKALMGAGLAEGALTTRTKELIALAIGISVRCDGCIAHHAKAVQAAGASRAEVVETIGVAMLMGGGPSTVYGVEALAAFDQFSGDGARQAAE
jgi:AhpD family alkylhydroperoxidase